MKNNIPKKKKKLEDEEEEYKKGEKYSLKDLTLVL